MKCVQMYKYEFTGEVLNFNGTYLRRIRSDSTGELGGWIEREENLKRTGLCWVGGEAKVYGNAVIKDDAIVTGNAVVCGRSIIKMRARVLDNAFVENAEISGNACVCENAIFSGSMGGNAIVKGNANYSGSIYDNIILLRTPAGYYYYVTNSFNSVCIPCEIVPSHEKDFIIMPLERQENYKKRKEKKAEELQKYAGKNNFELLLSGLELPDNNDDQRERHLCLLKRSIWESYKDRRLKQWNHEFYDDYEEVLKSRLFIDDTLIMLNPKTNGEEL